MAGVPSTPVHRLPAAASLVLLGLRPGRRRQPAEWVKRGCHGRLRRRRRAGQEGGVSALLAGRIAAHTRGRASAAHLGCSLGVAAAPAGGAGGVKSPSASARAGHARRQTHNTRLTPPFWDAPSSSESSSASFIGPGPGGGLRFSATLAFGHRVLPPGPGQGPRRAPAGQASPQAAFIASARAASQGRRPPAARPCRSSPASPAVQSQPASRRRRRCRWTPPK